MDKQMLLYYVLFVGHSNNYGNSAVAGTPCKFTSMTSKLSRTEKHASPQPHYERRSTFVAITDANPPPPCMLEKS
jgi:hypothetical protein